MHPFIEPLTWDRSRIEDAQEERLLDVVALAYERSSLTQDLWKRAGVSATDIRSRADFFERAPFMNTDDIRDPARIAADPFRGLLCRPLRELTAIGGTSGTTSLPQPLPQHDGDVRSQGGLRDLHVNGVGPGSVVLMTSSASRSGHVSNKAEVLGATPIFWDWDPSVARGLVEAAKRFRPSHWWILTGPLLLELQRYESETGDDLAAAFSSVGPVVWGGEPLGVGARARIEGWGLSIRQMTSLGNACATVECAAQAGSHTWEDLVLVECLDPDTDQPVPDGGRGELVVSTIGDLAAPMLRYRSGDLVEFTRERCSCGLSHGRLKTIGRLSDRVAIGDRDVLPLDVWDAIAELPATADAQFQLVRSRSTGDALAVRVGFEASAPAGDAANVATELADRLEAALGLRCIVEAVPLDELLRRRVGFKLPRVVED
jgi:phenylacetate-CoA ligase